MEQDHLSSILSQDWYLNIQNYHLTSNFKEKQSLESSQKQTYSICVSLRKQDEVEDSAE